MQLIMHELFVEDNKITDQIFMKTGLLLIQNSM